MNNDSIKEAIANIKGKEKDITAKQYRELYNLMQAWNKNVLSTQLLHNELLKTLYIQARKNGHSIDDKYRPVMV